MIIDKDNVIENTKIIVNGSVVKEETVDNIEKLKIYYCFGDQAFRKNLTHFIKNNKIKIELTDYNPTNETWGGELLVHINEMSTYEIVNYLIGLSNAEEIGMIDEKTLRLWWD